MEGALSIHGRGSARDLYAERSNHSGSDETVDPRARSEIGHSITMPQVTSIEINRIGRQDTNRHSQRPALLQPPALNLSQIDSEDFTREFASATARVKLCDGGGFGRTVASQSILTKPLLFRKTQSREFRRFIHIDLSSSRIPRHPERIGT